MSGKFFQSCPSSHVFPSLQRPHPIDYFLSLLYLWFHGAYIFIITWPCLFHLKQSTHLFPYPKHYQSLAFISFTTKSLEGVVYTASHLMYCFAHQNLASVLLLRENCSSQEQEFLLSSMDIFSVFVLFCL